MKTKPRDHANGDDNNIIITLVVAAGKNGVIGADGAMPWHVSSDLQRFKALTLGKPVVMGRKTWEAIGRPLPGRDNIVVTRDRAFKAEGAQVSASLEDALALASKQAAARGVDEVAIIGGGQIYAQTLPLAERVHLTEIDAAPEGDAVFPELDPALWIETQREKGVRSERDDYDFTFLTFERRD